MNNRRVLIVDSDMDKQLHIKAILGELQIGNVSFAANGEQALKVIEPKRIDLIITAWEMTPMDGKVFTQRLWSRPSFRSKPIIIYSKKIGVAEFRLLQELGMNHILPVPLVESELKNLVTEIFEKEKMIDPNHHKLDQAKRLIGEGSLGEAKELLSKVDHIPQLEEERWALQGEIDLLEKNYSQSEKHLTKALRSITSRQHPRQLLAKLYSETGRHAMAIDLLVQLVNHSPLNIELAVLLGEAQENAMNLKMADKAYKQALAIDPENPKARVHYGLLALRRGELELAKEFLSINGQDKLIIRRLNNQAIGLAGKGLLNESLSLYRSALKIVPNPTLEGLVSYNLGLTYKKNDNLELAFATLGQCVLDHPNFDKAYESFVGVTRLMNEKGVKYDAKFAHSVKDAREQHIQSA